MEQAVALSNAVERVNSRIDGCFGFERHTIRGIKKMRVRMGLALMVIPSMAVGFISEGRPEFMPSLVMSPRKMRRAA